MKNENARNTIIFVALSLLIYLGYVQFVLQPQQKAKQAAAAAAAHEAAQHPGVVSTTGSPQTTTVVLSRPQALAATPRVPIETPSLHGSISLQGARIDDLFLCNPSNKPVVDAKGHADKAHPCYTVSADDKSPVELFTPVGAKYAYFANLGWEANGVETPSAEKTWTLVSGTVLSPGHPVVLGYDDAAISVRRTIAVDDNYMFTVSDTATNKAAAAVTLQPYGEVQRQGVPDAVLKSATNVQQGGVGYLQDDTKMVSYRAWPKKKTSDETFAPKDNEKGGWLGITDTYWMAILAPDPTKPITGVFIAKKDKGVDIFTAYFKGQSVNVAPGASTSTTTHLFAGAKRVNLISRYEKSLGIKNFDLSIDWGKRLWPLTRAFFWLLEFFYQYVPFGVAILLLTVVVKIALFPLANQAFASMSKMKALQPKITEIKERYADDQAKQQSETMALYQREKINPLAGCLPMVIQLPIFLALLRVLYLAIDMRQARFLWLNDLSARDPSSIWTLFGLIPWNPAAVPYIGGTLDGILHLGIVAILYGAVMYLQQLMSPSTPDPTQQAMMRFMPLIFVFILSRYPVGLMIYWTWSALLSILQQYAIMHRHKVENPIDGFIARIKGLGAPEISVDTKGSG
ncbi:MAG TPA: membrane protein insertase YidC [Caulobacteraceae bacterium]|jgi:YidC/Oxa1 family membrane protein insertase|nr:membrane protein insertase YidC [Caulobacteraceae bacterium]